MNSSELSSMSFDKFADPNNFITEYDSWESNSEYIKKQYQYGLEIGSKAKHVAISCDNVWSADMNDNSYLSSCEKIGYHSGTSELLRGFLDSEVPIIVYRYNDGKISKATICRNKNNLKVEINYD